MIVFISGTIMGSNDLTPWGGHALPSSIVGARAELKKAQKNDTKRNTSEEMNKIIPIFSPKVVSLVWHPCFEDSLKTSWAQEKVILVVVKMLIKTKLTLILLFQNSPIDNREVNPPTEARRGHGLCSTMWFGWNFFISGFLRDTWSRG